MPFPVSEINYGGTFGLIATLSNQLIVVRILPVDGRLFRVENYGTYLLDEQFRYVSENGRAELYFFDQKGGNPISIAAKLSLDQHLQSKHKKRLEIEDLALYVDKIRLVESSKALIANIKEHIAKLKDDQDQPLTKEDQDRLLQEYVKDANFDFTVEKMTNYAKPKAGADDVLDEHTIDWLNGYFKEDIVIRYYLIMRQLTDDKYKVPVSKKVSGAMSFLSASAGKKNLALVCINNAKIAIETDVKFELNAEGGYYDLITKHYGSFKHLNAKARFKFGRQNIFVVSVTTHPQKPTERKEPAPEPAIEIPTASGAMVQEQKPARQRGRPPGAKNKPKPGDPEYVAPDGDEQEETEA